MLQALLVLLTVVATLAFWKIARNRENGSLLLALHLLGFVGLILWSGFDPAVPSQLGPYHFGALFWHEAILGAVLLGVLCCGALRLMGRTKMWPEDEFQDNLLLFSVIPGLCFPGMTVYAVANWSVGVYPY